MTASTSASIPPSCQAVQLALVNGELADRDRPHLDGCAECGFFARLSRSYSAAAPAVGGASASPLGAALAAVLVAAVETCEPLLGRYKLERLLGRGGQADVFRAADLETGETVAIKIVRLPDSADRSALEVAHARRIAHPNVARIYHTERYGGLRLIVMELLEGPSLAAKLRDLPRERALELFRGVCAGMAAAHAAGVLHLDLKPHNILSRADGTPVVTDFGLSATRGVGTRAQGGTPAYMAPEQRGGGVVDART